VVTFHQVRDEERELFRARLLFLRRHFPIVSLADALAGRLAGGRVSLALSFDDGMRSWTPNVVPVLRELELPATFFLPSGFIGLPREEAHAFAARHFRIRPVEALGWEEVRQMAAEPLFEIGGHTRTHADLGALSPEAAAEEVAFDKQLLEARLERPLRLFAYPFGGAVHCPPRAREVARAAGYEAAFTILPGFNREGSDPFYLCRDSLSVHMSERLLAAWLGGGYDTLKGWRP
jgi:peptidoglycan/xylan/chitin deacetylase (PgdA/CDA1 family)